MIQRARFQNFKSLRDVSIEFDSRLTVLVGPNGSGKTSVLQGLHFLTQAVAEQHLDGDYRPKQLHGFASNQGSTAPTLLLRGTDRRQPDGRAYEIRLAPKGRLGSEPEVRREGWYGADRTAFVRFNPDQLAKPVLLTQDQYPPTVGKDGKGLAATLAYVQRKHPEEFQAIEAAFRLVIPTARRLRFDEAAAEGTKYLAPVLLIDFAGARGVQSGHVSSGTLFALGLLTLALSPESANVLLIDDLDHGLHPKAQLELMDVFRSLVEKRPELQIIATAHSPYILDRLKPEEVRTAWLDESGGTIVRSMTDHPQYSRWREAMTPGEFWGTFYEEWPARAREPLPVG